MFALAGYAFQKDSVMQSASLTYDIAHRQSAEHPTRNTVIAHQWRVIDKIAILAIAIDDDAEHFFHLFTVSAEGGTAVGDAFAHLCTQPAFIDFAQRNASRSPDGIHQPHILLK